MLIGICEDNPVIREELIQEIQKQQTGVTIQLHAFSSGEAMLQSKLAFDLVFLDIELDRSGPDGMALAGQIREVSQAVQPVIIFVTGYEQVNFPAACKAVAGRSILYNLTGTGLRPDQ